MAFNPFKTASRAFRSLLDGDDKKSKKSKDGKALGAPRPELHKGPSNPTSTPQGPASSRSQGLPKAPARTYSVPNMPSVKTPEGAARLKGGAEVSHEQRQRLDMARIKSENPKATPKQLMDLYSKQQLDRQRQGKQSAIREA